MRIRNRKGNRKKPIGEAQIALYCGHSRVEGTVIDLTDYGLGVLVPAKSGFSAKQLVQIIYKRKRSSATIVRVTESEEGDHIGLRLA